MNNVKDFFLNNNKSGYKTNEKWLCNNFNELYTAIIINSKDDYIPFKEKIWLFINNLQEIPKCPNCGNNLKYVETLKKGHNKYCSIKCLNSSQEHKQKIINTNNKNHGVNSHNQINLIKKKKKKTWIKNYGVDNPMKSKLIIERYNQNLFNKYGVNNPIKIQSVIDNKNKLISIGNEFNIKRMLNRINNNLYTYIKHDIDGVHLICHECNNEFIINSNLLTSRLANNTKICTICNKNKSYSNILELITNKLIENNINFELNNRKILNGKEIDIYFHEYKLGVEINGLYWHSEKYKDNNYHLNKTELCEHQGIQLLHIFEDEINDKLDIVMSIIKSKLGIIENKIYARKTILKEIDQITCLNFLNNNHIQGNINSKIKLGLYYDSELVSVMTFGTKRIALGNKGKAVDNEYEMLRFCNKLDTTVVGGASKLLKYFIKIYHPKSILTFANKRYSNGNLYKQLGFEFKENTKPNYFYIKAGKIHREHRFKYRKDVLVKQGFDPDKTEKQIMFEREYLRIYDCGNIKYELLF